MSRCLVAHSKSTSATSILASSTSFQLWLPRPSRCLGNLDYSVGLREGHVTLAAD